MKSEEVKIESKNIMNANNIKTNTAAAGVLQDIQVFNKYGTDTQ